MILRPYQNKLVEQAREAFAAGHKRVLIQLPTGGGKTVILAEITRAATSKNSTVLIMAHRKEIVDQIAEKLTIFGLSHSVVAAGIKSSLSQTSKIITAMQQTLVRRLKTVPQPGLLITDEAHHQAAKGYQKITEAWPGTFVLGLTATPCRLDGKPLKDYFDVLITGPSVRELIDMGSLCDFTYLAPPMDPKMMKDLGDLKKRAGDYKREDMEAAVNTKKIIGDVVGHYRDLFNGKPVIAFCVSVAHGEMVADEFRAAGFRAQAVSGSMKKDERDEVIGSFRSGSLSILVSCDLIGEGFDVPDCAGVLLMRPTASLTIFLQQVGRALRPKEDGSKAIILDHVGNCYKHGRPDDEQGWTLEGKIKKDNLSVKQCPQCYMIMPPDVDMTNGCPSGRFSKVDCHYFADRAPGEAPEIEYIDGKLVEYVPPEHREWAGAIDIKTATGQDYSRLLRAAGNDKDKLSEIASIRGYTPGWVHVRVTQINRKRASVMG